MFTTFGERLRAAMATSGLRGPEALSSTANISLEEAQRWLALETGDVPATLLAVVAKRTGFRMYWLTTGEGSPKPLLILDRKTVEAMLIADSIDNSGILKSWFSRGWKLTQPPPRR